MEPQEVERRLTTILSADVVGYGRLMGEDEAGTLAALKAHRKELIEPKAAQYHGRTVKLMGDGALMEFTSVVDAVLFAVEVQCAMPERNAGVPEDRQILYRVGINIGDIIVEGDDIYGDGVNVAARLEGLADPGGICISRPVHTQIADKLDLAFEDLGEQQVKNIAKPVMVYRVVLDDKAAALVTPVVREAAKRDRRRWAAAAALVLLLLAVGGTLLWRPWAPDVEPASVARMAFPLPDKPSLAVLPFSNMSDDASQEYFADGLTDDLITDLSKISGLFVIARNSSFSYKGKQVKVRQVAEELGVRYVLEGSVRRAGDQVRINAQLIDATTGGHLWAERYDESMDHVFALQDRVVRDIVAALKVKLTVADEEILEDRPRPVNLEAYEWLLKGRKELAALNRKSADQARVFFERAIEADPTYARAYTNLGLYYWQEYRIWGRDKATNLEKAKKFGFKAVGLDPRSAGPRALLAVAHQNTGEHLESEKWGREALLLEPTQAETLANLGAYHLYGGRYKEAIAVLTKAARLDPVHPPQWQVWLGHAHFMIEEVQKAIEVFKDGVARGPNWIAYHVLLAASYAVLGQQENAEAEAQEVLRLNSSFTVSAYEHHAMAYTKNESAVRRMGAALRKAGLPE